MNQIDRAFVFLYWLNKKCDPGTVEPHVIAAYALGILTFLNVLTVLNVLRAARAINVGWLYTSPIVFLTLAACMLTIFNRLFLWNRRYLMVVTRYEEMPPIQRRQTKVRGVLHILLSFLLWCCSFIPFID